MPVATAPKVDIDTLWENFITLLEEDETKPPLDALAFCEEELGLKLYARQRLILKLFYSLPLTPEEEADWQAMLAGGNPYCRAWETGAPYNYLVIIGGRRGSKTTVGSAIHAYELYRLLRLDSPQEHYGVLPRQRISLVNCAAAEDQADIFFDAFKEVSAQSKTINAHVLRPGERRIDYMKKLRAERLHSNSRTQRGRTAFIVTFDELAHFIDTAGPNSDEKVYQALQPSTKTFGAEGKTLILTSPGTADGVTYEKYEQIAKGEIPHALCFQLASWELNENFTRERFDEEYKADPAYADMEYGAQFGDREGRYFPLIATEACFDSTRRLLSLEEIIEKRATYDEEELREVQSRAYYAHCDTGLRGNRLVFIVVHPDAEGGCHVDYAFWAEPGPAGEIDLDLAESHIREAHKAFKFRKLTFDQWNSALMIQRLRKGGIRAEEFTLTTKSNMEMYSQLKGLVVKGRLHSPEFALLKAEMLAAVRIIKAQGFTVQAPDRGPVRTDDAVDTLAAAVWQATQRAGERKRDYIAI